MRAQLVPVKDGIVTGAAIALLLSLPCRVLGTELPKCGEWVFLVGVAMVFLSGLWTVVGYYSPPGILGLLSGDVEIYPSANEDSLWIDRFISPRNVWLLAGLTMILVAFLPPFLGL